MKNLYESRGLLYIELFFIFLAFGLIGIISPFLITVRAKGQGAPTDFMIEVAMAIMKDNVLWTIISLSLATVGTSVYLIYIATKQVVTKITASVSDKLVTLTVFRPLTRKIKEIVIPIENLSVHYNENIRKDGGFNPVVLKFISKGINVATVRSSGIWKRDSQKLREMGNYLKTIATDNRK